MPVKKLYDYLIRHLNPLSFSVPIGVLVASVILPLRPVIQQALVGVLLVWFGVITMTGFPFRR
jgi:hypothetical protein